MTPCISTVLPGPHSPRMPTAFRHSCCCVSVAQHWRNSSWRMLLCLMGVLCCVCPLAASSHGCMHRSTAITKTHSPPPARTARRILPAPPNPSTVESVSEPQPTEAKPRRCVTENVFDQHGFDVSRTPGSCLCPRAEHRMGGQRAYQMQQGLRVCGPARPRASGPWC